jgi:quercetin dioxygenase-like cupin family protein
MQTIYKDTFLAFKTIREFDETIDDSELVWHRDKMDRYVTIIKSENWQFQFDDALPFKLAPGVSFFIPKETFHRVIKGTGNLLIEIFESEKV